MYAVFKGTDAQGLSSGPEPHEALDRAHQSARGVAGAGAAPPAPSGDLQRFVLSGAAFGHWLSCPSVSWACITTPESGQRVHLALCGEIENESEIAELYNVAAASPQGGEQEPKLCSFTSSGAKLLLDLYWKGFSDAYGDYSAQPETCLASLEGSWSFCLYDESSGYILAAASPNPTPATTLVWACCPTTGDISLTTASLVDLLDRSTVSEFPRGMYYIKSLCNPDGELASFMAHRMEMDADSGEQAAVCSQVFRVASGSDISGLHAGTDVQAQ